MKHSSNSTGTRTFLCHNNTRVVFVVLRGSGALYDGQTRLFR